MDENANSEQILLLTIAIVLIYILKYWLFVWIIVKVIWDTLLD